MFSVESIGVHADVKLRLPFGHFTAQHFRNHLQHPANLSETWNRNQRENSSDLTEGFELYLGKEEDLEYGEIDKTDERMQSDRAV